MTRATSVSSAVRLAGALPCQRTGCSAIMAGAASPRAWRVNSSSCFTLCSVCLLGARGGGRAGAGDAAEGRADRHADAGGIAFAEHVAGHHFAGHEEVLAGAVVEPHGRGVVHLEAQVG